MPDLPDPLSLPWPRRTARCLLRPITLEDVDAVLVYRSDPRVTRFLSHDPLDREEVEQRIRGRISGVDPTPGRLVRGLAIELSATGEVVGDAMTRTQWTEDGTAELWIGYALRPDAWGRGLATEVARVLVAAGRELGLSVCADAYAYHAASQRVLVKAGLRHTGEIEEHGRELWVFRSEAG